MEIWDRHGRKGFGVLMDFLGRRRRRIQRKWDCQVLKPRSELAASTQPKQIIGKDINTWKSCSKKKNWRSWKCCHQWSSIYKYRSQILQESSKMKCSKSLEYCAKCPSCQPHTVKITTELALINRTTTSNQSLLVSMKKEMHHYWAISGLAYKFGGFKKIEEPHPEK